MKAFTSALLTLVASLPAALADFDIYFALSADWGNAQSGWLVFDGEPDCDDAGNADVFTDRSDVSGSKLGFRCEGDGCTHEGDPAEITVLEMHPNDDRHWTIYADGNWDMVTTEGEMVGECEPFEGDSFDCLVPIGHSVGHRKFHCVSELDAGSF